VSWPKLSGAKPDRTVARAPAPKSIADEAEKWGKVSSWPIFHPRGGGSRGQLRVKGGLSDYVGGTSGVPDIADDLSRRPNSTALGHDRTTCSTTRCPGAGRRRSSCDRCALQISPDGQWTGIRLPNFAESSDTWNFPSSLFDVGHVVDHLDRTVP
jgi:hypothetical protein